MTLPRHLAVVLALAALRASGQQAPEPGEVALSSTSYRPPPQFALKADAKLVEIGVVVRDPRGHAVAGFTRDDFEIADEGRKREISAFSVETSAPVAPAARPSGEAAVAASSAPATVSQRYIALLFDDMSMEHGQLVAAQAAGLRFVKEGFRDGDHVALFTTSGAQNVAFTTDTSKLADAIGKLRVPGRTPGNGDCPAMTQYEAYLIANHQDLATFNVKIAEKARCLSVHVPPDVTRWSALGAIQEQVISQANAEWEQVLLASRTTLMTIANVVDLLGRMPESHTILMASSGFLSGTLERELDEVTRHAVHAGIVIDSIDAKGLYTESASAEKTSPAHPRSINNMQSIANASKEAPNDALASLAYNTGGLFFHNRNDLDAGFQELGIRPDISYLLAFIPDETPNGKYRHLKVRLKGPSHNTVQARLGYMAVQPPRAKPRPERRIDTLAVATSVVEEVPGNLTTQLVHSASGERGVMAVFHVDIQQLRFTGKAGVRQQKIILIAMLLDSGGNFVTAKEGTVTLALTEPTFNRFAADGMNFMLTLPAPPGSYRLRAVMEEAIEGKASAETLPVEVQ